MFGVETPILPVLYMMAGLSQCMPQAPPRIDIKIVEIPLEYSFDTSLRDLTLATGIDNIETGGATLGLTTSRISVPPNQGGFKISGVTDPRMKTSCVWFDEIRITLEVAHHVHISREIQKDACIRQAVLEHELEHVKIDFALLKRHINDLKLHLKHLAVTTGTVGPVPEHRMDITVQRLKYMFLEKVVKLTDKFREDRMKWQATIDTKEDKALLMKGCVERLKQKQENESGS